MINALDHTVLICPDLEAGISTYETLLGRKADWIAHDEQTGAATAVFTVQGCSLELFAPLESGPIATRLRELLDLSGPRLTTLAWRTDDIEDTRRVLMRRGLNTSEISSGSSRDVHSGNERRWQRVRVPDEACAGVKTFILDYETPLPDVVEYGPGSVSGLDHVVLQTPNPDRAAAIYGARFNIRMALDRTFEDWKTRLMFFRCGGLTLEVAHRFEPKPDADAADTLWGMSWIVPDLEAAHDRLKSSSVEVSEIRKGRRPATRVFTVKSGTLNVPTLFIQHLSE